MSHLDSSCRSFRRGYRFLARTALVALLAFILSACNLGRTPFPPSVTSINPASGPVGTTVTLTGRFDASSEVLVCDASLERVHVLDGATAVAIPIEDAAPYRAYPLLRGVIPQLPPGSLCPVQLFVDGERVEIDADATTVVFSVPAIAPGAPEIRSVTPTDGAVVIDFVPGANGGSEVLNYAYSLDDGSTWVTLSPADAEPPVTIAGLENGKAYTGVLRAVTAGFDGAPSTSWTAVPFTTPGRPDVTLVEAGDGFVNLRLSVNDDGGRPVEAWHLETDEQLGFTRLDDVQGSSVTVTLDSLDNTRTYRVLVRAENEAGLGDTSEVVEVRAVAPPFRIRSLQPLTISSSDGFGISVAVHGGLAIVGAPRVSPSNGFATVFERVNPLEWPRARTILHSDALTSGNFGFSVDVHGAWIAVGNPDNALIYFDDGGADVSTTNWGLISASYDDIDALGTNVAISDSIVMGASTGVAGVDGSFAFGSELTGADITFPGALGDHWVVASGTDIAVHEQRTAIASTTTQGTTVAVYDVSGSNAIQVGADVTLPSALLGAHIDLDGSRLAVGATNSGNDEKVDVYAMEAASWTLEQTLRAPGDPGGIGFGLEVAIDEERLLVAAPQAPVNGRQAAGMVFVFELNQGAWQLASTITQPQPQANAHFGSSVDLDGDYAIIGAPGSDRDGHTDAGAAYIVAFGVP